MNWIKLKYKQLKNWLTRLVLHRPFWRELWNSESDNASWEIWHDSGKKTVTLHYIPEEDYSEKDVKIIMPYEQFEDLVKFIVRVR